MKAMPWDGTNSVNDSLTADGPGRPWGGSRIVFTSFLDIPSMSSMEALPEPARGRDWSGAVGDAFVTFMLLMSESRS